MGETSIPCRTKTRDDLAAMKPDDMTWDEFLYGLSEDGEVVGDPAGSIDRSLLEEMQELQELLEAVEKTQELVDTVPERTADRIVGEMRG